MAKELLLEVGVEEIPAHEIPKALEQMRDLATRLFQESRLSHQAIQSLATPRRLVLSVQRLAERQSRTVREVQGPPKAAAFDAKGKPTPAAEGFAKVHGIAPAALQVKKTQRGEYLFAVIHEKPKMSADLLKELLPRLLHELDFAKTMRWGDSRARFVRPVRWILALLGSRVIPFGYAGLKSANRSYGHPLIRPGAFKVRDLKSYLTETRKRGVIIDPTVRRQMIEKQVAALARRQSAILETDNDLLEQNTFMVEYPLAVGGRFDPVFLNLPEEVLINVMREQQGYFSLRSPDGKLLPHFVCVVDVKAKRMKPIQLGHERVLKARLEDARFYFEEDQHQALEQRVEGLKGVIFHDQLGNLHEKMERLIALGSYLAQHLDPSCLPALRAAARLCKADLLTGMVREFPKLQGVIGCVYARLQGADEATARAIFEHYLPRSANDPEMPKTAASKFLAVADKMDTLAGFFGIGLVPCGSEDPYGLRRHGQGIVRILLDDVFMNLSLRELIRTSASLFKGKLPEESDQTETEVLSFLRERMQSFLRVRASEARVRESESVWFRNGSYRGDLVDAVLRHHFDNIAQAYRRIVALVLFQHKPEFDPLMVVFKRAARIVPDDFSVPIRTELFKEPIEGELFSACQKASGRVEVLLSEQRYDDFLAILAGLREPIDAFFAKVFVMDEDPTIRNNRLALLKGICSLFGRFADFSLIVVEAK